MICKRRNDAERQGIRRHPVGYIEQNGSIAFERELIREACAEHFNEIGPTVKVYRVPRGVGPLPVDSNSASAPALRGEVGRFAPLERFFNLTHSFGRRGGLEDECPQRQELSAHDGRVGAKSTSNGSVDERLHIYIYHECDKTGSSSTRSIQTGRAVGYGERRVAGSPNSVNARTGPEPCCL